LDLVYSDDDINLDLLDYQRTSNLGQDYWANVARAEKVSISDKKRAGANLVGEIIEYDKLKNTAIYHPEGILNRFIKVNDNIIYYKNLNPIENPRKLARDQLLTELNKMDPDHELYYNCIPDNSVAIDINTSLLGTDDAENMSNPRIWYDSNNINNKFVVSEIDAIYMEDGIKIARSSKR
jgi:hypothetical protein